MSTPSPAPQAPASATNRFCPIKLIKPYLTPYYIAIAAVLGAITAGFVAVTALLIIVALNFNVLGWME